MQSTIELSKEKNCVITAPVFIFCPVMLSPFSGISFLTVFYVESALTDAAPQAHTNSLVCVNKVYLVILFKITIYSNISSHVHALQVGPEARGF